MLIPIKQERRTWPSGWPSTMSSTKDSAESPDGELDRRAIRAVSRSGSRQDLPSSLTHVTASPGCYRRKGAKTLICLTTMKLQERRYELALYEVGEVLAFADDSPTVTLHQHFGRTRPGVIVRGHREAVSPGVHK